MEEGVSEAVGVEEGVCVKVGVGVKVCVGVNEGTSVGPSNCPGPHPETSTHNAKLHAEVTHLRLLILSDYKTKMAFGGFNCGKSKLAAPESRQFLG